MGWGGSLEAEAAVTADEPVAPPMTVLAATAPVTGPVAEPIEHQEQELLGEEMIEDHYAALQAWTEWAQNRGRASSPGAAAGFEQAEHVQASRATLGQDDDGPGDQAEVSSMSGLRAELQHEHAPYSQLFSRLRQSK